MLPESIGCNRVNSTSPVDVIVFPVSACKVAIPTRPSAVEPEYRCKRMGCRTYLNRLRRKAASLAPETSCVVFLVLFTMRNRREQMRVLR